MRGRQVREFAAYGKAKKGGKKKEAFFLDLSGPAPADIEKKMSKSKASTTLAGALKEPCTTCKRALYHPKRDLLITRGAAAGALKEPCTTGKRALYHPKRDPLSRVAGSRQGRQGIRQQHPPRGQAILGRHAAAPLPAPTNPRHPPPGALKEPCITYKRALYHL